MILAGKEEHWLDNSSSAVGATGKVLSPGHTRHKFLPLFGN